MAKAELSNIVFKDAKIIWKNFSGEAGDYNKDGVRSFHWVIEDPELADTLAADGWNVKKYESKAHPESEPIIHLPVFVDFVHRNPNIRMIVDGVTTRLDEDTVGDLDHLRFVRADININPYIWTVNGNSGVKAQIESMKIWIQSDPLDSMDDDEDIPF